METKALVGERGAYRLAKATQTLQIPATAQAILAARIDRLSPENKRLLQAASVIGKDVPFVLLCAVAEGSEEEVRSGLSHLHAAEFLYEARLFPDLELTFKHALTQEVAYNTVLLERRRVVHERRASDRGTFCPTSVRPLQRTGASLQSWRQWREGGGVSSTCRATGGRAIRIRGGRPSVEHGCRAARSPAEYP